MIDIDLAERQGIKVLDLYLANFYSRRRQSTTRSIVPRVAAPLDPIKVGALAKKYREDQHKAGIEISASDAVAHVIEAGR